MSALEAFINAAVGLVASWLVTFYALPLWGYAPSASASLGITAMYFCISFVRAFILREAFRKWAS